MPDRVLQNHYCVAALQHRLSYNGVMSLPSSALSGEPVASTRRAAGPRRARARSCRACLAVVMLLGTGVLAAACTTASSVTSSVTVVAGHPHHALAFVHCMRTHGEPDMPDPVVEGNSVRIIIKVGSGVSPESPRFTAAFKACKYLTTPGKSSGRRPGLSG
jgi:hypothetical protein